jgi:phenylalanyl-tRNA synthetase beta chain
MAISENKVNFTDIKQIIYYILGNLDVKFEIRQSEHPSFISGRQAEIVINKKAAGIFGEINPKVLASWGIDMPTAALEINLSEI